MEHGASAIVVLTIIPVFNGERTIARAIDSAIAQDLCFSEIIVIDDGSTDCTSSILDRYRHQIRIVRQPNKGAAAARNAGARRASGKYLAFLDADDEWLPDKLRLCVGALECAPSAAVAYSDIFTTDADGRRILHRRITGSPSLDDLLNHGFALFPSAIVVRREVFERCDGFPEEFSGAGFEDIFAALRFREHGEFVHIARPLVFYDDAGPSVLAVKYAQGHPVFVRLVSERYGNRGRNLILDVSESYASFLLGAAKDNIRARKFALALSRMLKAMAISPTCVARTILRNIGGSSASMSRLV